jgi:hypothetical protein
MKQPSKSMAAFKKRQADRAKQRTERDADIRESFKAGATLAELGRRYLITMERVRQIARDKADLLEIGKAKRAETQGRPSKELVSNNDSSSPKHSTRKQLAKARQQGRSVGDREGE